jgi:ribosomal protein S1
MSIWTAPYKKIEIVRINEATAYDANDLAYEILESESAKQFEKVLPISAVILLESDLISKGLVSIERENQITELRILEIPIGEILEVEVKAVTSTLIRVSHGLITGSIRDFKRYPLSNNPPDQWLGEKFMVEKIGPMVGIGHHFSAKRVNFENMTSQLTTGNVYTGKVTSLIEYGAFVNVTDFGYDALLHKTNMNFISNHLDVMSVGDEISVLIQSVDRENMRINVRMVDF